LKRKQILKKRINKQLSKKFKLHLIVLDIVLKKLLNIYFCLQKVKMDCIVLEN
jgi:hypothetical protein